MILKNADAALRHWATARGNDVALRSGATTMTYARLNHVVDDIAARLEALGVQRCAILLDNGPGWVAADLALRRIGGVIVPIPLFFSAEQMAHALGTAGADAIITDDVGTRRLAIGPGIPLGAAEEIAAIRLCRLDLPTVALPEGTQKITFTSGTTGRPKGVCLSAAGIDQVARALCAATEGTMSDRHLSIMPFAALLENIAGIDIPLLAGAEFYPVPLGEIGFSGSSGLQPAQLMAAIDRYRPTSIVTVPQILAVLMTLAERAGWRPDYLRHVAVGGAVLAQGTIAKARSLGLPAYEGYGLSECASVVALNTRAADCPDSVGKPLPHCRVELAPDAEVLVYGSAALGYLGGDEPLTLSPDGAIATGDLGRIDADGFLHLVGRKKNMFITAFGRNVAPDWVESELMAQPAIAQAFVHGEARPWNAAIIVPSPALMAQQEVDFRRLIATAIDEVNAKLPDYARVRSWILADQPFLTTNNLLTWNGRLRRREIEALYRDRLDRLYEKDKQHVYG
ncbi:AMP-binding protein [Dongia sp.]|uniref:AMP-binding protein n=1 Tax=Dongia sp. TaxID=1977262 RepID=UPI0035B3249D